VLGVLLSGAYGPTASPTHFLSHGYPAEVLVIDGKAHLIRVRDRPEDLLAKQRLVLSHATGPVAKELNDGATFEYRPRRDDLGAAKVAGQALVS
jgi:hypothetical protein